MPRPRKHIVSTDVTPYYHITTRCVRRAFLCGQDQITGQCFEHRRQWIEDRIRILSSIFSIDVCAYAVMNNHYHLVVKLNPEEPKGWSDFEVLKRWQSIFKGPLLIQKYARHEYLSPAEFRTVQSILEIYSNRLGDISWFMKCLNEFIARRSNAEDDVTGHFWEARFSSQALCTEAALLTCMAYVDLNPVRARIAATPEKSRFTSIHERHRLEWPLDRAISDVIKDQALPNFELPIKPLLGFYNEEAHKVHELIPISFSDYTALIDWTGRAIVIGKRGAINSTAPPILERLNVSADHWLTSATGFEALHRGYSVNTSNKK